MNVKDLREWLNNFRNIDKIVFSNNEEEVCKEYLWNKHVEENRYEENMLDLNSDSRQGE